MKYIAQPQFASKTVSLYSFPLSGAAAIKLGPFADSPNSALIFQDSSGAAPAFYLFVAFVTSGNTGYVSVFNLDAILASGAASQNPAPLATLTLATDNAGDSVQPLGMAIQPGTCNLYVGTTNNGFSYGTVNTFTCTRGAADSWSATGKVALSFNNSNGIAGCVSNVAFDLHGNLWLTTFDNGGNFLCCFTVQAGGFSPFLKLVNGPAATDKLPSTLMCTTLAAQGFSAPASAPSLYPLSGPEGIAFDPAGNLWLANNNEEYLDDVNPKTGNAGGGSVIMISGAWLDNVLYLTNVPSAASSPTVALAASLKFNGVSPITTWYINNPSQPGGICFDGYTLFINDENNYGSSGQPVVWQCDTSHLVGPAAASVAAFQASFKASGVTTTNPGNGSMSVCIAPYSNPTLTVRDVAGDTGAQPDAAVAGTVAWESPDILVGNSSAPPAGVTYLSPAPVSSATPSFTTSGTIATGSDAYLSVRVSNYGTTPSMGSEVLILYWAFASTGLDWPVPWDGSAYFSNMAGTPLGGTIGQAVLPVIPSKQEIYVQVVWHGAAIPNPANYVTAAGGSVAESEHFCLYARIQSTSVYPYGMCFPEQVKTVSAGTALVANAVNNSAIGWRNITIMPVAGGVSVDAALRLHILGANYSAHAGHFTFVLQTVGRTGLVEHIPARVTVHAEGPALTRLRETKFEAERFAHLPPDRFHWHDREKGMAGIHLAAGELLPFAVEFKPEDHVRDFAVRIIQYVHTREGLQVAGGQTFISGHVALHGHRSHK